MSWIERVEQSARQKESERQKRNEDRKALEKDPKPTPAKAEKFLKRFVLPVNLVIEELRGAGYKVEESDPGFFQDGDSRNSTSLPRIYSGPYSLGEVRITDVKEYWAYEADFVFGQRWEISKNGKDLGIVSVIPTVGKRKRLGGITYKSKGINSGGDYVLSGTSLPQDKCNEAADGLRTVIGAWISTATDSHRK